jgi:outer membrane murein-binding lipoprotein Lpp
MADAPNALARRPHKPQAPAGVTETDAQLKTLVLKLSTQVEELTAMVSQFQQQREASTSVA